MTQNYKVVETTLRIPGAWGHPGELLERLPAGYRPTPKALLMPDGQEIEFHPLPPDEQFADIFQSSCRRPATADELRTVRRYLQLPNLFDSLSEQEAQQEYQRELRKMSSLCLQLLDHVQPAAA